jgi:hypothetical protein
MSGLFTPTEIIFFTLGLIVSLDRTQNLKVTIAVDT